MGMVGGMMQSACDEIFGGGTIEFRPGTLVAIGRDGTERVFNRVEYRSGGARVAVLPQEQGPIRVMVFDFNGANRITETNLRCVMARAGTGAAAGPVQPDAAEARTQPPAATATGRPAPAAVAPTATHAAGALRLQTVYTCNGERVVVLRCRSEADDAFCSVQYPDRKSAATGGLVPELTERRGELVKKLQQCQDGKS